MNKIHQLPEHIIARIAAGEVIERPVYAVKELVENGIDAAADSIAITIEESGLKKIVVTDNGEGMSAEDLAVSFKPHTTSKISDELMGIKTLGFRGEALASIAAISNVTIQTRLKNEPAGSQVSLRAGEIEHFRPIGIPPGTTVTVGNLFYTVPARKKFLKTDRTEFRHIVELLINYALSYPEIRFLLMHNKRVIFDLPKQSLQSRLQILLGKTFYNHLLPLLPEESHLQVSGFITRPQISTKSLSKQYIFVNKRAVSDKLISTAVKDAYGSLLESTRYPVFVIFLTIPHEAVDVNVHPRKEQVSFISSNVVYEAIRTAVTNTLLENNLTFANMSFSTFSPRLGTTQTHAADLLRAAVSPWTVKEAAHILDASSAQQIHNLYLLVQTKQGLLFVDQHAAHERILYEQFYKEFKIQSSKLKIFRPEKPVVIDLPFIEAEMIAKWFKSLKQLGFDIDEFGGNSFKINSVPELLKDRDIREIILELLEQFNEYKASNTIDSVNLKMLSYLACSAAIKAGEKLTSEEAKRLLTKLENTANNATCPHGRPTRIEVSLENLHSMFKRK